MTQRWPRDHFKAKINADLSACPFFKIGQQLQKWQSKLKNCYDFWSFRVFFNWVRAWARMVKVHKNCKFDCFKEFSAPFIPLPRSLLQFSPLQCNTASKRHKRPCYSVFRVSGCRFLKWRPIFENEHVTRSTLKLALNWALLHSWAISGSGCRPLEKGSVQPCIMSFSTRFQVSLNRDLLLTLFACCWLHKNCWQTKCIAWTVRITSTGFTAVRGQCAGRLYDACIWLSWTRMDKPRCGMNVR